MNAKVYEAAKLTGAKGLTEYCNSRPCHTFAQLAAELSQASGFSFVPIHISHALRDEAVKEQDVISYAKSSLVRHVRHLMPEGWGIDAGNSSFNFSRAIGAWASLIPDDYRDLCDAVIDFFSRTQPFRGWLPSDANDYFIERAFRSVAGDHANRPPFI